MSIPNQNAEQSKIVTYEDYDNFSGRSALSIQQILDLFGSMNWQSDAFLAFDVDDIHVFQVLFHNHSTFLIEITDDSEEMIYNQRYANYQECIDLIDFYFSNSTSPDTTLFHKVPVNLKTLDEVLREKIKAEN